ncbi:MAG TPA: hypothetical protein VE074_02320, partial [Jatrophihabitantaceae bacterium]|nr:hypothetical protein [Jatrophihabitantaceae bacterium]
MGSNRLLAAVVALVVAGGGALGGTAATAAPAPPPAPASQPGSYNGLALTPPMGFNNWAGFECNSQFGEALFVKTADAIVKLGLNKLGYDYVNIDDC